MDELLLTEVDKALIDFTFSYRFEIPWNIDELYYYRSGKSLKHIFSKDDLILRLTVADQFEDKLEGKAVEVYFDIALEEMLNGGELSPKQFEELSQIDIPNVAMFCHKTDNGIPLFKWEEFSTYIICFSKVKDDPYMFEKYVHNKETGGFCVEFSSVELDSLSQYGMENEAIIKLIPVMYGYQTINYIKDEVRKLIQSPYLYQNKEYALSEVLHTVQFSAKRSRFNKENEIRMVVYLVKDDIGNHRDLYRDSNKTEEEKKKYLNFRIPKHMVFNVTSDPLNVPDMTERMKSYVLNQGYRMID